MHKFLSVACLFIAGHVAAQQTTNSPARLITLQECIERALQDNLDLKIERLNPLLDRYDLEIARSAYDPVLGLSYEHSYRETAGTLLANGFLFRNSRGTDDQFISEVRGLGPMGLNYSLFGDVVDSQRSVYDDELFQRIPSEGSSGQVGIALTQPLLRNFLTDQVRTEIAVSRLAIKGSEQGLRLQIITTITDVEQAYYELIFARENVKVQQEGLRLAERLYADDVKRMEIGMIPRLDEKQSESQVAARQADLSTALRSLATAQNDLKKLITSDYRQLHNTSLNPTESLTAVFQAIDIHDSWSKGLELRPELQQAKLDAESAGITLKFAKNQLLPQLDLTGSYGYSAGLAGAREYTDAFQQIRERDHPFWSAGAIVSVPLANKGARESLRRQRMTVDQRLLELRKQEEDILVAVDEAVNGVRTSYDRVQSTRKARQFAEEALTAEQQKLQSGKSTSFVVLQLQRDLTSARSEEIRALADYNNALAELYRAEGTTLERKRIILKTK